MPRWRRRDESGQAFVEAALVFPIVALMVGVGITGWSALQGSVRLTTAARAAAIIAAHNLEAAGVGAQLPTAQQLQTAKDNATTAVNQEEGVSGVYQDTNSANDNYVNATATSDTLNGTGVTIYVVTVKISHKVGQWISLVPGVTESGTATARYG